MIINFKKKNHESIIPKLIILFLFGLTSSFSLPPYNLIFINFIIYPAIFLYLTTLNQKKKISFFMGVSFGSGFFGSNLYWISNSLKFDDNFQILIPFALIVIPLLLSIFFGLVFFIASFLRLKKDFSSLLLLATIFSFIEFVRGSIWTGFPWNLIVFSLANFTNTIQILSYIGTYSLNLIAITFFLLPSVFFLKINNTKKILILTMSVIVLFANFYFGQYRINNFKAKEIFFLDTEIKIVSPQIKLSRYFENEDPILKLKDLIKISNPDKNINTLFIYPEGVLTGVYLDDLKIYEHLFKKNFSNKHKLILGINDSENSEIFNTLVMLDNNLNLLHKYKKNNLVPFGEFLPLEKFFFKIGLKKITQGYQSFSFSDERKSIDIGNLKALPLICYEIIYTGNLSNNLNFDIIINISEDGWFGDSIGPHQHFVHSIFRSIEEGKNIFRSSNNGYSGLITPIGSSENLLKSTESGVISINKIIITKKTLFSSLGNKIFFYFIIIYITLIFILKRKDL